jgi:hypothetical protein
MHHNLLYALLMGGDAIGFERLIINSDVVPVKLAEIPENARYAQVILEVDPNSAVLEKACRFLEAPAKFDKVSGLYTEQLSTAQGMPLGHLGIYEIKDAENLKNFRILNLETGKTNLLMVQYFG